MILVLAGTKDGREIAAHLAADGYAVIASAVSDYGRSLLKETALSVNDRPLPEAALESFLTEREISLVVDTTHPYAAHISVTAMRLTERLSLRYIRYERAATMPPAYDRLFYAADYAAAATQAARLGRTIFLTTGSRNLRLFSAAPELRERTLIARVLPEPEVIRQCRELGLTPRQIIALQGPFSHELNREMYRQYRADVVVTKDGGAVGGTDTKLSAAMELGLPVVMLERPRLAYPCVAETYEALRALLPPPDTAR